MAGEKKILDNQGHMMSALDKIEMHSEKSEQHLNDIVLNIGPAIISGVNEIKDELKTQTALLGGILKELGGKPKLEKKDDISKNSSKGAIKQLSDGVESSKITDFAKVLLLLGGAFYAFGKGIGAIDNVSMKQVLIFSTVMLTMFGAINLIYKNGINLSIGKAIEVSIVSIMFAMMITDVARIMSTMEMPSLNQLGMAVLLAATMVPIAMYIIKTISTLDTFSGGVMSIIEAPIVAMASLGSLIMLPMIALSIVATANIFRMMPSKLSTSDLSMAITVGLTMLPIAYVFVLIYRALRGPAGSARLMSAVASRIAKSTSNPLSVVASAGMALAIIPLVALTMVATAWIFKALPNKFPIPPISWIMKVGVLMITFSVILKSLQGLASLQKTEIDSSGNFSKGRGKTFQLVAGMFLMAGSLVATAWIFKGLPTTYKAPPIEWTLSVGLAMYLFTKAFSSLMSVFNGKDRTNIFGTSSPQKVGFKEIIVGTVGITMLGFAVVAIAHIMNLLPSENMLKAPPLSWVLKVGIAMYLFSKAVGAMVSAFKGTGVKDKIFGSSGKISTKDILNVSIAISLLALSVVSIAYIMKALPPDGQLKSPPLDWTIKVGLAMLFFSKSMKSILQGFGGKMTYNKLLQAGILINMLAFTIVTTSYIMMLLPAISNLKSPTLKWTINVGLAMLLFSKATKNILQGLRGSSVKEMIMASIMINVLAASIVTSAIILQALPSEMKAPPLKWTITVGLGMLLFGGAISMLLKAFKGGTSFKDLFKASAAVVALSMLIVTTAWIYKALPNKFKSPPLMWTISVGIGMVLFSAAIYLLSKSKLKPKEIIKSIILLNTIAVAMVSTAWAFMLLPNEFKAPPIEWVLRSAIALTAFGVIFGILGIAHKWIKRGAQAMLMATGSILLLASAMIMWSEADIKVKSITILGLTVAGLTFAMGLAGLIHKRIKKGAFAMSIATIPIILLAAAMIVWSKAKVEWKDLAILGAAVVGLGVAMGLAGLIAPTIVLGALSMALAAIPIILLGKAMQMWTEAGVTWKDAGMLASVVAGLALEMAAAGAASPLIIAGAAALGGAGLALIAITKGLKNYGELYSKYPQIVDGDYVHRLIQNISSAFSLKLKESGRIAVAAPALVLAGAAISKIAKGLKEFSELKLDVDKLSKKVAVVISTVADSFAAIGTKYGGNFLKRGPVALGVAAVRGMGRQLSKIAKGVQDFANLTYVDENGKRKSIPEVWLQPGGKIPLAIQSILKVVGDQFAELGRTNGESGWFSSGLIEKGISAIKGAGKELSDIAKGVISFASLKYTVGGKEYVIQEKDLMPEGRIPSAIRSVLTVVGNVFAELGRTNGETGWFSKGLIETGIKSVKGAGEELGNIASAIINFANLKYSVNGKDFSLTKEHIGEFDEQGNMIKPGKVYTNMRNAILSITSVLGEIGKDPENESSWWPGKSNLEKGRSAIIEVTKSLTEIASFVNSMKNIEDTDVLEDNIRAVLTAMPRAIVAAQQVLESQDIDTDDISSMLSKYPTELADAIERIAKHQTAMEKVAESFGKMSISMVEMKDAIQVMDNTKLENLSTLFNSVRDIQKIDNESSSDKNVSKDIAKGIEKGMDKVMDVISKFSKTSNDQTSEIKKLANKEVKAQETTVVVDNSELVNVMKSMIEKLESMNEKLIEVPVRVMNENNSVQ